MRSIHQPASDRGDSIVLRRVPQYRVSNMGVTLIELMIALVVGLIVSGSAIALVVSVMKSNADTIRATRLTQELRTTAEIVTRDLSRARSVNDPVANVGMATLLTNCNTITATSTCIRYGYDCEANSTGAFTTGSFRAVGLVGGKVRMVTSPTTAPACPTASDGVQLSSDSVIVETMDLAGGSSDYTLTLKGKFANDPTPATPLRRSFAQEVQVKSALVQ